MNITKEQVLNALDLIEKYKEQQNQIIQSIEVKKDPRSIAVLGLKTREINTLKASRIETIGELLAVNRSDLRRFRYMGEKGVVEINKKIKDFGIDTAEFIAKSYK